MKCAERNWDLDANRVKAPRTEKEKKAMATEEQFDMEGNKKADDLAKDGAEVDGQQWPQQRLLSIKQLRK